MKHLKNELAVERKADAKLYLVLARGFRAPAGEDRAVLYDRVDAVGDDVLHGDLFLTVKIIHALKYTSFR